MMFLGAVGVILAVLGFVLTMTGVGAFAGIPIVLAGLGAAGYATGRSRRRQPLA